MTMPTYKIAQNLYLVGSKIGKGPKAKPAPQPVHHIAVIDCSGSMYYDLPKIREQLKRRIPKLLAEKDVLSVVWFSGRGQFGTLLEVEPVAGLTDLQAVNQAIDRWLRTVGLTGFKEPVEEVARLAAKHGGYLTNMFFMSDGCDNQWRRQEILQAVEKVATLSSVAFVEYGYYADRPMLTAMAEKAGGSLVFSKDFDQYAPLFEEAVTKGVSGAPRVEVSVPGDPVGGFAFAERDGALLTFGVEGGKASVPEDVDTVWCLTPSAGDARVGTVQMESNDLDQSAAQAALYAAVSLYSVRMMPEVVYPLLKVTGDVAFIEQFGGCFGKQRYADFMEATKAAALDASRRLTSGYDPDKVPPENAFTVLDLLRLLSSDDGNRLLLDSKEFKYQRIGRGRVDADSVLTEDERKQVDELTKQMAGASPAKIKELAGKIASITGDKVEPLKFEADPAPDGYPLDALVYNENRPNVSVRVKKTGTVDLSSRDVPAGVPAKFSTFVYRNYTIIRDGIVNVEKLPVRVTEGTYQKLCEAKMAQEPTKVGDQYELVLDLTTLPVVNRAMVKRASAKDLFLLQWELTQTKAAQKVYNAYLKERFPRVSTGFAAMYGEDVATWLKEQGLTDYSGFQPPHTTQAEASDFYMAKELSVKLKGFASLPSLKDVAKKRTAGKKLTGGASLMAPTVDEIEGFLASDIYKKAADKDAVFEAWLKGQARAATAKARKLMFDMAQIKYAVVVGQIWFTEFASVDENTLTITVDGQDVVGTVEMKETKVEI